MQRNRSDYGRTALWLVVGATLVGALLRLYDLAHLPISSGFDPAYYGLDALAILDGEFPVYLATNFGREVLFSYMVAIVYAAIGLSDFGIHLTAAFVGILTIPMNYTVAGELLRGSDSRLARRWGPVLAAAVLAVSYWHVVWSRYGVRAILAPFFVSLTMFLLLRALRTGSKQLLFLAGLAAGASLYTYQIGQLLPLLLLVVLVIDWWARRKEISLGRYLLSLVWLGVPFLVAALPMLLYAGQNPDLFNQRVRDVAVVETAGPIVEQAGTLGERLLILARFFTVQGDPHDMWSIGRLPGLNSVLLAGFLIGLLILIWSWRKPLAQVMIAWLLIMLLPAVLAGSGTVSKRGLGALPLITVLIALGLTTVIASIQARDPAGRVWKWAAVLIAGGVLLFSLAYTANQYFIVWGGNEEKDGHFDPHLSEMGAYIAGLPPETQIYLSADAPNHPNMLLHSQLRTDSEYARGYNGWRCFVYPAQTTSPTTYVLSEEVSVERLREAYPSGQLYENGLSNRYGYDDYFIAYHIPAGQTAETRPDHPLQANWAEEITLYGYDLQTETIAPGEQLQLALYWSPQREMDTRYTVFVHLLGEHNPAADNPLWAQKDGEPCTGFYPTAVWREGEIIRDEIKLDIAPDVPPGTYDLAVGFYTWPDFQRLPVGDSDSLTLQQINVDNP